MKRRSVKLARKSYEYPEGETRLINWREVEPMEPGNWPGIHGDPETELIICRENMGSKQTVMGRSVYAPGASHDPHCHFYAEEFIYCLSGKCVVGNGDKEYIMDVNVKGTFLCSRETAKVMLKQGNGKIINISSLQGFLGRAGDAAYATSKAAVNLMTMSMACEWAKNGIRVNAIAPTWCWTDLTSPKLRIDNFYNKLKQRIPIGRAGNRDDIFGIVVFLASEASDFVNGAVIPLDGGATGTHNAF